MGHSTFPLTATDKQVIRQWHDLATVESLHRGDGAVTFPDETVVLQVLSGAGPYRFNEMQVKTILAWAEKVFNKHYGGGDIRNPEEERVFRMFGQALPENNGPVSSGPAAVLPDDDDEDLVLTPPSKNPFPLATIALIVLGLAFMMVMLKLKSTKKPRPVSSSVTEPTVDYFKAKLVTGTVLIKPVGSRTWDTLTVGQEVHVNDTVKTDSASRVEFDTPDGYNLGLPEKVTYVLIK